jgi:FAD:protein FMN transferase
MQKQTFVFEAIGTHWQIDIDDHLSAREQKSLLESIHSRIAIFDKNYSRFRDDSLIVEIAQKAGTYTLPEDAQPMMELYKQLYQLTDQLMTPCIGQVMVDAGYDAKYSLEPKKLSAPIDFDRLTYKYPELSVPEPVLLDFGAAGKGYLIDLVADVLRGQNITSFCIDAGGDILHQSTNNGSLRIGLENPLDVGQVIGVVTLANQSICGSAGNRRKWKNFHHIIDPKTLTSPEHILATWVVASSTLLADGLATALYFAKPEKLQPEFSFEYVILHQDFSIEKSAKFPGEFFYSTR